MTLKPIIITRSEKITEDTTMDEEYQIQYWASLPEETRRLIAIHYQDQWDTIPAFVARYQDNPGLIEQEG